MIFNPLFLSVVALKFVRIYYGFKMFYAKFKFLFCLPPVILAELAWPKTKVHTRSNSSSRAKSKSTSKSISMKRLRQPSSHCSSADLGQLWYVAHIKRKTIWKSGIISRSILHPSAFILHASSIQQSPCSHYRIAGRSSAMHQVPKSPSAQVPECPKGSFCPTSKNGKKFQIEDVAIKGRGQEQRAGNMEYERSRAESGGGVDRSDGVLSLSTFHLKLISESSVGLQMWELPCRECGRCEECCGM